jgi:spore coat polysaccharide biosynthesis protein SpsF
MENYGIIIFSRTGSSRLPNKALMKVGDYKLLELIIKRLKPLASELNLKIILATTTKEEDDELVEIAKNEGILWFKGDELDVMNRTKAIIEKFQLKAFCRVNGDCPLVDRELIKKGYFLSKEGYDLVSNIIKRSFPYGIAVEWISSKIFIKHFLAASKEELEHVTKHLYRLRDEINSFSIENEKDLSSYSIVIDTYEDLVRINEILKTYRDFNLINLRYNQILKNDYPF